MQLAKAAAEGRVAREKAITRVLPELAGARDLGKLSLQRLLDGRTGLQWSDADITRWRQEAGWAQGGNGGVRAWLGARPSWPRTSDDSVSDLAGPEGELLLWAVEKAWRKPAPELLCDLQASIRSRSPAFWATDATGTPLADGLALSLSDFASLGQAFLDARNRPGRRSLAPAWFIDSVANPLGCERCNACRKCALWGRTRVGNTALPIPGVAVTERRSLALTAPAFTWTSITGQ
jgi:hypothetical protein